METPLLQIIDTITDLKNITPVDRMHVLLVSKTTVGDNLGGFYRWDSALSGAEDTVFMDVIPSNIVTNGRWSRVFQKAKQYSQGILVNNGGVKTFYCSGTTNSNGEITINITDDNTTTGNALFSEIWTTEAQATTEASGPATAVQSYRKSMNVNLKQIIFGFYKANAVTVTLGLLFTPVASVGSGITVQMKIEGI